MRKRKNHYDSLGVPPDATPDQIKRAYRGKARETHPDKGGDAEEFAAVAAAYDVLSDPARRLLYDATGQQPETQPIEIEVRTILLGMFNQALAADLQTDIITAIRKEIKAGSERVRLDAKRLEERAKKLEKRRSKITSTSEVNLAHLVIDGELKNIAQSLAGLDHQYAVEHALLTELDAYSEEFEAPKPKANYHSVTIRLDDIFIGGSR